MASVVSVSNDSVCFRPHQYLAREHDRPNAIFRIEEGWACRFHLLNDGRRQVTALFLPGDYCEPQWGWGRRVSQPIVALTRVRAVRIDCVSLTSRPSDLYNDLRIALVATVDRQAEWIVSLGRKSALERIAQLLYEIYERMDERGLAFGQQCAMPLTQSVIADVTGLTPVHVNRTLQVMRSAGLVRLQSRWLRIPDLDALRRVATGPMSALNAERTRSPIMPVQS